MRYGPDYNHETHRSNVSVELPKLKISKLRGDCKEYRGFSEDFDAAVNMYSIRDVQKLMYLKRYLDGEAQ